MAEIKIDSDLAVAIFRDAFLQAIPKEERDRIFREAIGKLLTEAKETSGYGSARRSWLHQEMQRTMEVMARELAREQIEKPEYRQAISTAVESALARVIAKLPDLVGEVADKVITKAIDNIRYDN